MPGLISPSVQNAFFTSPQYDFLKNTLMSQPYISLAVANPPALPTTMLGAAAQTQMEGPRLLLTGSLLNDNSIEIAYSRIISSGTVERPRRGDIIARLLDANGTEVLRTAFAVLGPEDFPHQVGEPTTLYSRPFSVAINFDERAKTVVLERSGKELLRLPISINVPTVTLIDRPTTDQENMTIRWRGSDADGDQLSYDVSFVYPHFPRIVKVATGIRAEMLQVPISQLPGGTNVTLRIEASDGFNVGMTEAGGLQLPNHSPSVLIIQPQPGSTFQSGAHAFFRAVYRDLEEPSLSEDHIRWSSDRDGELGRGEEMETKLSDGVHLIKVEVIDSNGGKGNAEVRTIVKK
jgi:hypothetical protein